MAGKIHKLINSIVESRSDGNNAIANCIRTKLILKGIDPFKYDENSEDDEEIIAQLKDLQNMQDL
ncbi:hypothetical protein GF354_01660 [Candidatus Peregrinibacteria bacterium]|nr:hypothetical protein [Candidatus Peregrinibacteria bacterium]